MSVQERALVGRWFLGAGKMPADVRDYIVENEAIPDGLTDGEALANDLKTQYEAHRVDVSSHNSADSTNVITEADATTVATLIALANDLKAMYTAHIADATAHNSADIVNVITLPDATTLQEADLLLNEIMDAYTAHIADASVHDAADTTNVVTAIHAYAWYQTWVTEAGGSYELTQEVVESKRQGWGVVKVQRKSLGGKITVPMSTSSFLQLKTYAKLDTQAASDATVLWLADNFGDELEGIAVLAYPADADPGNTSDIPNFINSDETIIVFNGVNKGVVKKDFSGEQGMLGLELDMLADVEGTAGKALGKKGGIGTFAAFS